MKQLGLIDLDNMGRITITSDIAIATGLDHDTLVEMWVDGKTLHIKLMESSTRDIKQKLDDLIWDAKSLPDAEAIIELLTLAKRLV